MRLIELLGLIAYSKHGWMIVHSVTQRENGYGSAMRWIVTARIVSGGNP